MRDMEFIQKAAISGDSQAMEIYQLVRQINDFRNDLIRNAKIYTNGVRVNLINAIYAMELEKDHLIHDYNLPGKKAKIYLENLRREKREERVKNKS